MEADGQRPREMDLAPKGAGKGQQGRTHGPDLPPTLCQPLPAQMPPRTKEEWRGRNYEGTDLCPKGTVLNQKKPTSFKLAASLPAAILPSKMLSYI